MLQKQPAYNFVHGRQSAGTSMNIVAEHPRKRTRNDDREDGVIPERIWNEHGCQMMEPGLQVQNTQIRLNKPTTSRTTSEQVRISSIYFFRDPTNLTPAYTRFRASWSTGLLSVSWDCNPCVGSLPSPRLSRIT